MQMETCLLLRTKLGGGVDGLGPDGCVEGHEIAAGYCGPPILQIVKL